MLVDTNGRQFRIGAYGLAVDNDAVLLVRISPSDADAGMWTLPGGGLEWGEHPLKGLEREFVEETGLKPSVMHPLGIHSFVVLGAQRRLGGPDLQVVQIVYQVTAQGTLANESDGSTDEARWWRFDQLPGAKLVELVKVALDWISPPRGARPPTG